MTDCEKRPTGTSYYKLEALIFGYLLIVAMLCVYDYDNLNILATCLLLLMPIKIISTWFQEGWVLAQASYKGDISDLIIHLGQNGLVPKNISLNSYLFSTNLRVFPNTWCIVMHDGDRSILIGANGLISKLSRKTSGIKLIKKV